MRVLLAHNYYRSSAPSGEDTVYRNERALLERNGIEVIPFERANDDIDDASIGARVGTALQATWSRQTVRALGDLLKKASPDVAHFHNTFPLISPSAYAVCKRFAIPVVQTLHNFRLICPSGLLYRSGAPCELCVGTSLFPALRYRCYRDSRTATAAVVGMLAANRLAGSYVRNVDRYVVLTRFAARLFARGGLPGEKICVKPNSCKDPKHSLRAKQREDYAIFVGRLSREKGIPTLLEAWRGLPAARLVIAGDGPLRDLVETACASGTINAEFLGFRPPTEIHELVAKARFQVVPSECYEGFPMVIAEAYAHGVPVLAARIGALEEIVRPGETGSLFESGNAEDLQAQAHQMIDVDVADRLGCGARAAYEQHYSDEHNFAALMQIYKSVREQAGAGDEGAGAAQEPEPVEPASEHSRPGGQRR